MGKKLFENMVIKIVFPGYLLQSFFEVWLLLYDCTVKNTVSISVFKKLSILKSFINH